MVSDAKHSNLHSLVDYCHITLALISYAYAVFFLAYIRRFVFHSSFDGNHFLSIMRNSSKIIGITKHHKQTFDTTLNHSAKLHKHLYYIYILFAIVSWCQTFYFAYTHTHAPRFPQIESTSQFHNDVLNCSGSSSTWFFVFLNINCCLHICSLKCTSVQVNWKVQQLNEIARERKKECKWCNVVKNSNLIKPNWNKWNEIKWLQQHANHNRKDYTRLYGTTTTF